MWKRNELLTILNDVVVNKSPIDIKLILYGNEDLSVPEHKWIFNVVKMYIYPTKSFTTLSYFTYF